MAITKVDLANVVTGVLPVANGGTGTSTGVAPGGSTTQVQYNNAGAFGGSANFVFDGTNVGVGTSSPTQKLDVAGSGATRLVVRDTASTGVARMVASGADAYFGNSSATGTLNFQTNNSNIATFDVSGNLGLGVTPNAWSSSWKAFQTTGGSLVGGTTSIRMAQNWYNDGTSRYVASRPAAMFVADDGAYYWYTAPSGTAGNAITFTQAMTLDASGNLILQNGSSWGTSAGGLNLAYNAGAANITTYYDATSVTLGAGVSAQNNITVNGSGGSNNITFKVASSERMRIDSSGNVGIGTSSPSSGLEIKGTGAFPKLTLTDTSLAGSATVSCNDGDLVLIADSGGAVSGSTMTFWVDTTERMRIDSSGNVFVGGTTQNTSTNPVYSSTTAKAWCNFTQSGTTVTVQASFNISSVTRTGTGAYTVNFTNALADNKYAVVFGARQSIIGYAGVDTQSAGSFTMYGSYAGGYNDLTIGNFVVFR